MTSFAASEASPEALSLQLHDGMTSLAAVREFLRCACTGTLSPEQVADALLLGTELVTNALRHGAAPVSMEVARVGSGVRIAVFDRGSGAPRPTVADPSDESGRGLGLLQALSEHWGVRELDNGKVVWFTLGSSA